MRGETSHAREGGEAAEAAADAGVVLRWRPWRCVAPMRHPGYAQITSAARAGRGGRPAWKDGGKWVASRRVRLVLGSAGLSRDTSYSSACQRLCITIVWLRRVIVGSFRHVNRRNMAGGTRHMHTPTTHAHAQMLYNIDFHSVFH